MFMEQLGNKAELRRQYKFSLISIIIIPLLLHGAHYLFSLARYFLAFGEGLT